MYSVYKITNLINNKCYIGSSIRVDKRWKQHINDSKNINSEKYNYPLYKAFRKYGIDNFKFEILSDDFDNAESMQKYENEMIIFYNSYNNGYNQTYNTNQSEICAENLKEYIKKISKKCAKVDNHNNIVEIYNSYHDAARQNGMDENNASIIRKVCKGHIKSYKGYFFRDLDYNNNPITPIFLTSARRKKIFSINVETLEESYYESISDAARKNNIERKRIQECIKGNSRYSIIHKLIYREIDEYDNIVEIDGYPTIEEKIVEYNTKNPVINGERHCIKEWCDIYNISTATYYNRRKQGMDVIEAIITPKRR